MTNRFSIYRISRKKIDKKMVLKEESDFQYNFKNIGHAVAFARIAYARQDKTLDDVVVKYGNGQLVFSSKKNEFYEFE